MNIKDIRIYDEDGKRIKIPVTSEEAYNRMRHSYLDCPNNYEETYSQLRYELFENYVHSETEQEAVKKLLSNH